MGGTALAVTTAAAIVLRSAVTRGACSGAVVAALTLVLGALMLSRSARGYTTVTRHLGAGAPTTALVDPRGATAAVVLLAAAAILTAAS